MIENHPISWRGRRDHPRKGRSNQKMCPGKCEFLGTRRGRRRGRSRAKKETNKEGKSCAAPRRCCPRSQISLRTYYGYFSCGPLLQSLPRNRNRARLFGIMFRWRQEFQEVLIPDIRGCRASSSFHIILVMVGELTLTAQTFAGKKFPKFRYSLSRRSLVFPFYSPTPSALSSVSCRLCSYVHAIRLQRNINWGCSVRGTAHWAAATPMANGHRPRKSSFTSS